jgi:hypothetical protein
MDSVDCGAAACYYRKLGWRTGVFGPLVWTIAGSPAEALDMPDYLGRRTLELTRSRAITCPVFAVSDCDNPRWVFLTGRRDASWHVDAARLRSVGVEHLWASVRVDLPPSRISNRGAGGLIGPPRDEGAQVVQLKWLIPPVSAAVPTFSDVADAVLDAANT